VEFGELLLKRSLECRRSRRCLLSGDLSYRKNDEWSEEK
jgi:hypothetical protein